MLGPALAEIEQLTEQLEGETEAFVVVTDRAARCRNAFEAEHAKALLLIGGDYRSADLREAAVSQSPVESECPACRGKATLYLRAKLGSWVSEPCPYCTDGIFKGTVGDLAAMYRDVDLLHGALKRVLDSMRASIMGRQTIARASSGAPV